MDDPVVRNRSTISFNELTEMLKKISALKRVVILDACASGKAAEKLMAMRDPLPSSVIRSFDRMKDRTGTYLLAGCASDAVSYEASRYGQGLLTYSLLFNMRGAALRDGEYVDVRRLFESAADQVPELAAGISGVQRPQIAAPGIDRGSFDIGRVTAGDREKIPLKSIRPVFMRSNFQEETDFTDLLDVGRQLDSAMREVGTRGASSRLLYVDAVDYPGGYQIVGRYRMERGRIRLDARINQGKKKIGDLQLEAAGVEELIDAIMKHSSRLAP